MRTCIRKYLAVSSRIFAATLFFLRPHEWKSLTFRDRFAVVAPTEGIVELISLLKKKIKQQQQQKKQSNESYFSSTLKKRKKKERNFFMTINKMLGCFQKLKGKHQCCDSTPHPHRPPLTLTGLVLFTMVSFI